MPKPQTQKQNRDPKYLSPKPLKHELVRQSLLEGLETSEEQLIALTAPSGYGKTTILGQHARSTKRLVAWLSIDAEDGNTSSLAESIRQALLNANQQTKTFKPPKPQRGASPTAQARALATSLNDLDGNLDLILDGVERLEPETGPWLEAFLDALGEGHRVLTSSYVDPPVRLSRRLTAGKARQLRESDLAFSGNETRTYTQQFQRETDTSETPNELEEQWPAVLALSVQHGSAQRIEAFFVDILEQLPAAIRAALPEAAVLEVWDEQQAEHLGVSLPNGWINTVIQTGLPVTLLGQGQVRPHQRLRDHLEQRLRLNPERHHTLHHTAGTLAEAQKQFVQALEHYRAANAEVDAWRMTESLVQGYERRWEYAAIRRTLSDVPEEALPPRMRSVYGQALFETGDAARGEAILRDLHAQGHRDSHLAFRLAIVLRWRGRHADMLTFAQEALDLASNERERMKGLYIRASARLELGEASQALEDTLEFLKWADAQGDLRWMGSAYTQLENIYYELQDPHKSELALRQSIEVFEAYGAPAFLLVPLHNLADFNRTTDRLEEALSTIDHAIDIGQREDHVMLSRLYLMRGFVNRQRTEFQTVIEDCAKSIQRGTQSGHRALVARAKLLLADTHHSLGQLEAAAKLIAEVRANQEVLGDAQLEMEFQEGLCQLWAGNPILADTHFATVEREEHEPVDQLRARLYRAEIARQNGTLTREHAEGITQHLKTEGNPGMLRVDARALASLYAEFTKQHWWPHDFAAQTTPAFTPDTKQPLTLEVITFGQLSASIAGSTVRFPVARAGELIAYLTVNGPSTREQLIDALWDGSNRRAHAEYFKVVVRRARAALSEHAEVTFNPLPLENDRYRLNEAFQVNLDVHELETALTSNEPDKLELALQTYKGPFLPNVESEWAEILRHRYAEDAIVSAMTLGQHHEQPRLLEALKAYQWAFDQDPLHPKTYEALIRVAQTLGDKATINRANRTYQRAAAELE
jgi:LuxR family transcriptional regulator, maltose regulon positive regulatory protein